MNKVKYISSTNDYHLEFIKNNFFKGNPNFSYKNKFYFLLPNSSDTFNSYPDINKDKKYIFSLGKMCENGLIQKGMTDLILTVYYLKYKNLLLIDFNLIIVGKGEGHKIVSSMVNNLELNETIDLIQEQSNDNIKSLISNSKAVILLSRFEGQSMFITEALSLQKPVLITIQNGMNKMLVENENGFELLTGNYEYNSRKILDFWTLEEKTLEYMGLKSKLIYDNNFSGDVVASKLEFIIDILKAT